LGFSHDFSPEKDFFNSLLIVNRHHTISMKSTIISVLTLVVACAVCSLVTYRIAYDEGFARAKELQKGVFVGTMDALEKLRGGQTDEGIRRIESVCFSAANTLYGDPRYRNHIVTKSFAQPLIHYRDTYRTNRAEWTPAEERLEGLLRSWRQR
jgi:hypothetical protein